MIDKFIKCQVNIFVNTNDILPETSTISKLLELFQDKGLIPSTIHELVGGGPKPRLRMSSPDNQWNIIFLSQKIRIEQIFNPKQSNDAMDIFLSEVKEFARKIFGYLNQGSCRLAFIVHAMLEEKTTEELQECYNKLFIPLPTYATNLPTEWNNRSALKKEISLADTTEMVNVITEIKQMKVQLNLDGVVTTTDRLLLQYEFNTVAENKNTRFNTEQFGCFMDIAKSDYDGIDTELEGMLNA